MSAEQQPERRPWEDRLDRFHEVAESRKVTKLDQTTHTFVGALAALVDDATWDKALERVEEIVL